MQYRSGSEIRETFLRFFETKGHRCVHSSSLVPANDPTLLFTNAGMNQFKDVFLGLEHRDYLRATSSQKCVRAGGKHNDLENVGFTRRHHTFFEMLGNFSFGDYFKKDAIAFAWELVTSPEWFGLPKDKLYVTIFKGENGVPRDDEAYALWMEQGVPEERIGEYGSKDNFWQMGDTGPCGPCSEIFYDMGIEAAETPGVDKPFGEDDARYVEIWNLVFMQFDRSLSLLQNLSPSMGPNYDLNLLPKPSIDTGMGLERIAAVLQGVNSNFETDLFVPLIKAAAQLTLPALSIGERLTKSLATAKSARLDPEGPVEKLIANASLRIVADHARAATFLISDGVLPANEGRGYVLRKILRRGIRHGRLLGQEQPFMFNMVFAVRDEMQDAYPELKESADRVAKVVEAEERQFARVIALGSNEWDKLLAEKQVDLWQKQEAFLRELSKDKPEVADLLISETVTPDWTLISPHYENAANVIRSEYPTTIAESLLKTWNAIYTEKRAVSGKEAFHLYETYGLPLDFMMDAARDAGIHFDLEGFEQARAEEQARARASWKGGAKQSASPVYRALPKTEFEGYAKLRVDGAEVLAI
ncbi:MAG TPA: alanine--tRNA ligase, partial [Acidobacteriaceae bacterium]|nr:alanine--tRNA ligase [Acidobacteriaceae bacterium]